MKNYYSLVTVGETATLNIYGDISSYDDASVKNLSKQLEELDGVSQIDVYINSYGGEVAEGLAIYNALKRQKAKVITHCDGFACSIASVVFMAGEERKMSKASLLMIHNAWTVGMGNAQELRKLADDLEVITSASVEAYKSVATISEKKIKELMDAETWIKPKDGKKYGFVTEIVEENTENPSQNVRKKLYSLILELQKENIPDDEENPKKDDEKPENEDKNADEGENGEKDDENGEKTPDKGENDPENDEKDPEKGEKQENAAEKFSGFFNAIMKL